jgi:alkylation response protein AidB-like acyl-CoA dehydrogenase
MATAGFERGVTLRSPARYVEAARRLAAMYAERGGDEALRDAVVAAWMDAEAYWLHTYHTVSRVMSGAQIGAEASLNKIFWSEMDVRIQETGLRLLGDSALLLDSAPDADPGHWLHGWMASLAGTIFAGTNEIQRNIVADRVLDLPRGS